MTSLGGYRKYLFLCSINDPVETPSWMIDGIHRKMYYEAFNRAVKNLPSNPQTPAGVMGRADGTKKRKLMRLVTGKKENCSFLKIPGWEDFDDDIPGF